MRSFNVPLALTGLLASSAAAQFMINTPLSVQVCLPVLLSWTGGNPPYFLSILPAGQPSANALVDLGQQNGNSVTWIANLPVGTGAFLNLRDNTGALAQSGTFNVQSGSNTSCVGQSAVTSAGPAVTGGSSGGGSTQVSANSGAAASQTTNAATTSGVKTTTSPSPSKAAAVAQYAPVGAAALIGAAILSIVV